MISSAGTGAPLEQVPSRRCPGGAMDIFIGAKKLLIRTSVFDTFL
jgi:hypothetical protein